MMEFVVSQEDAGKRLDAWLAASIDGVSRSAVGRALDEGRVLIGGAAPKKAGQKLRVGDVVSFEPPDASALPSAEPEDIPVTIVHEDDHLVIVDKEAGMVVHPAPGHPRGTLVNALAFHIQGTLAAELQPAEYGVARPGIVHRLDRGTSGLLVVAKTEQALRRLQAQFKAHTSERVYLAVVIGTKLDDQGTIETLFARSKRDRKRMTGKTTEGKVAVTHWEVLARSEGFSLLRLQLETGRTHQIRVHLAEKGYPVVGDQVYGRPVPKGRGGKLAGELAAARRMERQALHAAVLGIKHPETGEMVRFVSQPPRDFEVLMRRCFGEDAVDEVMAELG